MITLGVVITFVVIAGILAIYQGSDSQMMAGDRQIQPSPMPNEPQPTTSQSDIFKAGSSSTIQKQSCSGNAKCLSGQVTKIIDGDTIQVDGQSIRFALSSTPELNQPMGEAAKKYVQSICPVGSKVTVDEDDKQTQGSYGRIVGVVYCNGMNLNQAIINEGFGYISSDYCKNSEFSSNSWAQSGCSTYQKTTSSTSKFTQTGSNCDPNYSGTCIPKNSPDLDCSDFSGPVKVSGSDPHGLDRDGDGIGCE